MSDSEKLSIVIRAMGLLSKNDNEGYNLTSEEELVCKKALDILGLESFPFV